MPFKCRLAAFFVFMVCGLCTARSDDGSWGTLSGQFVLEGDPPAVQTLEVLRDEDVCGQHDLKDESLIVNPDNQGIRNIAVYLYSRKDVPIHPSLQKVGEPVTLDNKDCRFHPRMLKVRTGQKISAVNSDAIAHNVACYAVRNEPFNLNLSGNNPTERAFSRPEIAPLRIECSIHPWMRAHLIVSDHPYVAITDKDGRFRIPNIPAGEWEFRFWHENNGYLKSMSATIPIELKRGRAKLKITSEGIHLGRTTVPVQTLVK